MRWRSAVLASLLLAGPAAAAEPPLQVTGTAAFISPALGLTVVSGELALPSEGWEVVGAAPDGVLDQVQLSSSAPQAPEPEPGLPRAVVLARQLELGRRQIESLFHPWDAFPGGNNGRSPASLTEALEWFRGIRPQEYQRLRAQVLESSPYREGVPGPLAGPFYAFPPGVRYLVRGPVQVAGPTQPLALELRPWVDDGKHWVLLNTGRAERRAIDRELLAVLGAELRPVRPGEGGAGVPPLHLYALLRDPSARQARVTLRNLGSGASREVAWQLSGAAAGDSKLLRGWARAREQAWQLLGQGGDAAVLQSWLALSPKLYGNDSAERGASEERERRGDDRSTDAMGILGGRAALEETLQMQLLGTGPRLPEDLLAWWRFDDCTGANAARSAAPAKTVGSPACVPGVSGSALELAAGQHLTLESIALHNGALTVAGWVRLAAEVGPTEARIIGMGPSPARRADGPQKGWGLAVFGAGHRGARAESLAFHWVEGEKAGTCLAAGTALEPGRWRHVAAVASSDKVTLYVDGVEAGSCAAKGFPDWFSSALAIGRDVPDTPGPFPFAGAVDDLRIYRRALPEKEVRELHAPRTGPIPIAEIKGVEVKSHPFEELLAGADGVRLPLAEAVPPDRFLLWFGKPSAVFPFLEEGADFLFRVGSAATRNWVDDDLKGRYLRRLGLSGKLGRAFLESGEVTELAIVAPDLFFIDGTDVTVLMRLKRPAKIAPRLKDLGLGELSGEAAVEKRIAGARSAWWALRGDLLLAGTSREELQSCLDLARRDGEGSLGRSAELRYMLSRQPPTPQTRAVAYFSDAFVRRLTGPAVKIGQLRRMQERARMVQVTAGALLRRLDTGREERDLARLEELGYTPKGLAASGWRLRDDLAAASPQWGTASALETLAARPVEGATEVEAQLYRDYVEQYSRYWRQYFDPIVLRLDDGPGGGLSLGVFVLPLADSQLYGQLRQAVAPEGAALRVPRFEPEPLLQFSANVAGGSLEGTGGFLGRLLLRYSEVGPRLLEKLGPGVHLAVLDADPVVALGNGDLLGGFGSRQLGRGFEAFGVPMLLSVFTRPCKIAVELKDPAAALEILRGAARSAPREGRGRELLAEFRQVGERDAWMLTLDFASIAKLRLGLEVQGGFLVLSNSPWGFPAGVTGVALEERGGVALQLAPGAVKLGLPALFATQQEQNQAAVLKGIGALYPLLAAGAASPAEAARRHAALWGSTPLHPGRGEWVWKQGRLASSVYGDAARWRVVPWREGGGDFGVFEGVQKVSVVMRFEGEGLRAHVSWTPSD